MLALQRLKDLNKGYSHFVYWERKIWLNVNTICSYKGRQQKPKRIEEKPPLTNFGYIVRI